MKNKRNLLLLPLLLLPVVGLTVAFAKQKELLVSDEGKFLPFIMTFIPIGPAIYCLATVLLLFIFIVTYRKQSHTDEERAAMLFFVKSAHLILGAATFISLLAYTDMNVLKVSLYFYLWLLFSLLLSGCFGFFLLLNVVKSTRLRTGRVFLVCVLQFVFVLDVVSGLLLWLRIKKSSRDVSEVEREPAVPEIAVEEKTHDSSPKNQGLRRFRFLLLLPGIFLPYLVLAIFIILRNTTRSLEQVLPGLLVLVFATLFLTISLNLLFVISGFGYPNASGKIARANMVVRLLQIPGYIINLLFGMLFMITIFTMAFSILIAFLDMLCLLATGILGTGAVTAAVKEDKMPVRTAFFASSFNYIYCLDVVYAIVLVVYLAARRFGKRALGSVKIRDDSVLTNLDITEEE